MSSSDELVLSYLKKNPNSKPREIADGTGLSLTTVRIALNRLRERGLVVRTSKGYMARHGKPDKAGTNNISVATVDDTYSKELNELRNRIENTENIVKDLWDKVRELEKMIRDMRSDIDLLKTSSKIIPTSKPDVFIDAIRKEKILTIGEARKIIARTPYSLEKYINDGVVYVVRDLVVYRDFLDAVMSKLPIKVNDLLRFSTRERILIEALIAEGVLYIDRGKEIKKV